jgi:hypothetical protein
MNKILFIGIFLIISTFTFADCNLTELKESTYYYYGFDEPSLPFNTSKGNIILTSGNFKSKSSIYINESLLMGDNYLKSNNYLSAKMGCIWINYSDSGTQQYIYSNRADTYNLGILEDRYGDIFYIDNNDYLLYSGFTGTGTTEDYKIKSDIKLKDNNTYFVCWSLDNLNSSSFNLYINGSNISSTIINENFPFSISKGSLTDFYIGGYYDFKTGIEKIPFYGDIDEMSFFQKPISSDCVEWLYNGTTNSTNESIIIIKYYPYIIELPENITIDNIIIPELITINFGNISLFFGAFICLALIITYLFTFNKFFYISFLFGGLFYVIMFFIYADVWNMYKFLLFGVYVYFLFTDKMISKW